MKSALRTVAFSNGNVPTGILAMLEVALEALDDEKSHMAGACVNQAIVAYSDHLCKHQEPLATEPDAFDDLSSYG